MQKIHPPSPQKKKYWNTDREHNTPVGRTVFAHYRIVFVQIILFEIKRKMRAAIFAHRNTIRRKRKKKNIVVTIAVRECAWSESFKTTNWTGLE